MNKLQELLKDQATPNAFTDVEKRIGLTELMLDELEKRSDSPAECRDWLVDLQSKLYYDKDLTRTEKTRLYFTLGDTMQTIERLRRYPQDEFNSVHLAMLKMTLEEQLTRLKDIQNEMLEEWKEANNLTGRAH